MAAVALEEGTCFDGERLVQDVSFNVACRAKQNLAGADGALYAAADRHIFGKHFAMHEGLVADYQADTMDIAFDPSIDLDISSRGKRPVHDEIGADDRWGG
jgi:hypothetical protein